MTVETWVNENLIAIGRKPVRIIFADTNKGAGAHWILFKDCIYVKIKITSQWVFLYI